MKYVNLVLTLFVFLFPNFSYAQTQQNVTPADVLIYERSENPWNNSWGKTYPTESIVTKSKLGQILHTSGNLVQIFDPNTLVVTEAVSIMFDLNITTDKKNLDFAKDSSWFVSFDRPNNRSTSCSHTALHFEGNVTSNGHSTDKVIIDGKIQEIDIVEAVWTGYWRSCYSGKFTRKVRYSEKLQVLTYVEFILYFNNSVSDGHRIILKEIKRGVSTEVK